MKLFRPRFRPIFCGFVLIAFLLPSYRGYSAFDFILLVFSDTAEKYGLTSTDAFVAVSPLIFIPILAIIIAIRSLYKLPTRRIYTMLPLLFLLFFLAIIIDTEVKDGIQLSGYSLFTYTHIGFYIMILATLLLPFTRNHRRKRIRKPLLTESEIAV